MQVKSSEERREKKREITQSRTATAMKTNKK
jgi:hypothetical protein